MTSDKGTPQRVVVDGSNLATEGRSLPSLAQLDEAVRSFREEHVDDDIIVVVDASFSYRIDESERQILEDAEEAGEIVSPPAGAIGRGDGFLLRIADRTGAVVLSNDSFQEFHGEYKWLFEEGRLIGGKPVPGVGWIFTPRTPVRGPKSRVAVRDAERAKRRTTKKVEEPVAEAIAEATAEAIAPDAPGRTKRGRSRGPATTSPEAVNEPLPFITFIANHRLGSEVDGVVDSFTSHGAFVNADGARCYAPVVGLGDPPPRSAKEVLTRGETRTFVVQALDPPRRGIELALPGLARLAGKPTQETVEAEIDEIEVAPASPRPRRRAAATAATATAAEPVGGPDGETTAKPAARRVRKRAEAPADAAPVVEELAAPTRSRRGTAKAAPEDAPIPDGAAAQAAPPEPVETAAPAKSTRRRTAQAAASTAPTMDGSAADGPAEAAPAKAPAMKRSSTRAAARRTATAAPANVPADVPGAPSPETTEQPAPVPAAASAAKRTRKAPSKAVVPADGPMPDGPTPDGPTPDGPTPDGPTPDATGSEGAPAAALARPGPRRSTIKKVASATGGPGRAADMSSPASAKAARPRRAATKADAGMGGSQTGGDGPAAEAQPKPSKARPAKGGTTSTTSTAPTKAGTTSTMSTAPTKASKSTKASRPTKATASTKASKSTKASRSPKATSVATEATPKARAAKKAGGAG